MRGLPHSSQQQSPGCFGELFSKLGRIFKKSPELHSTHRDPFEKKPEPYRHVPRHAASGYLDSTTSKVTRDVDWVAQDGVLVEAHEGYEALEKQYDNRTLHLLIGK